MRTRDRVYAVGPEPVIDYNRLHACKTCQAVLCLDVAPRKGAWYVVTRCRCAIYSVETCGYVSRSSALRKRRLMYAAVADPLEGLEVAA